MHIEFERTGGFAGMRLKAVVQTESLPAAEARELHALIADADFFNLPHVITSPNPGIDQFRYQVTVEKDKQRHTVQTSDVAAPNTLRPLLRRLTVMARASRSTYGANLENGHQGPHDETHADYPRH